MAITITPYVPFVVRQVNGNAIDFDTDTIKAALVTDSYTPDTDAHDFFDDVSTYELASGDGYTTGGLTLSTPAVSTNTTDNRAEVDYSDLLWTFTANKTFRYLVLYKSTGTASTSGLIALVDFGANRSESANFYLRVPATGLIHFKAVQTTVT